MSAELIFNLWAIYDAVTGTVYGLSGKAYNVAGTDSQKLAFLKAAAGTDYITATRFKVPERFGIVYPDGQEQTGVTYLNAVQDPNSQLFEDIFKNIEAELPPIPDFSGPDLAGIKQKAPKDPLCVVTILYEDEVGNIRPIITDEDREWIALHQAMIHGQ